LIWFPYILAAGGIFAFVMLCGVHGAPGLRRRLPGVIGLAAGAGVLTIAVYATVISLAGFHSLHAIGDWISRSRYGKLPDRGLLRMLGGIPRGFFSLGDLNTGVKQILFAHRSISAAALLRTGVWKVALTYLVFAASAVAWWTSRWGRRLLVCLCAIAIPLLIFAAFLFEATPPERYLAAFPLLFLGFGGLLADRRTHFAVRLLLAVFFISLVVSNVSALFRFRSDPAFDSARLRLDAVNQRASSSDRIVLLSYQDQALHLVNARPFDPLSRNRYLFIVGLPWGAAHKERWKIDFAGLASKTWDEGGRLWLSLRFLAARPDPAWGWVEGDLPGIGWHDLVAFFRRLDLTDSFGGPDGFAQVARTARNETFLSAQSEGEADRLMPEAH